MNLNEDIQRKLKKLIMWEEKEMTQKQVLLMQILKIQSRLNLNLINEEKLKEKLNLWRWNLF